MMTLQYQRTRSHSDCYQHSTVEAGALPSGAPGGATTPGVELLGRSTPLGGASRRRGKLPHRSACRSVRTGEAGRIQTSSDMPGAPSAGPSAFPGLSLCTFGASLASETQLSISRSISSAGYQSENAPRAVRFLVVGSVPRDNVRQTPYPPYATGPGPGGISLSAARCRGVARRAALSALRRAATALVWDGRLAA